MRRRLIFVGAILASSFLIFLVQPMVGKRILPWFGGTPSVWSLCLAFYQTTLFLGYAYAHCLIRYASPGRQLTIHGVVIAAAIAALPVLPSVAWRSSELDHPNLDILAMLGTSVALPFVVLASTGPLVQAWFARANPHRSPYPLYAVSNVGSFSALLAYPFLFEPRLSLSTTGTLWSVAFVAAAAAVLVCAFIAYRAAGQADPITASATVSSERPRAAAAVLWVALSACAVVLLMGVTNAVCLDVASVPFLWILPLATYLLTFILCFASDTNYRPMPSMVLTIGAFFLTLGMRFTLAALSFVTSEAAHEVIASLLSSPLLQIPAYCALLFGSCMILHGELYRSRPPAEALTGYYLCISGGGALGGLFVGLLAPILFDDYHEIRIGLFAAAALFLAAVAIRLEAPGQSTLRTVRWRFGAPLALIVSAALLVPPRSDQERVIHRARAFFGVLTVIDHGEDASLARQRHLMSGSTLHGVEFLGTDTPRPIPSSYFGRGTAVAAAFARHPDAGPMNVGIIGLGIGTLSSYGRAGDSFRYYEIGPEVAHIARDSGLFSFLERSEASVEVVLGDARLVIEREQGSGDPQDFDLLVLDAFSSDAIPVHLLTVEAFEVYTKALAEGGVLAVHATNRYLDLTPLVARAGLEVGLQPLIVRTLPAPRLQSQLAEWILLSADPNRIRGIERTFRSRMRRQALPPDHATIRWARPEELADVPLWRDDYSDLLSVLRTR